jgi:ABC-type transport system involved in cytochrome c biogenesis ATPase subunit
MTYIQGRSGVGKTTLFKIFFGLLSANYGSIYLEIPKEPENTFELKMDYLYFSKSICF